MVYVSSDDGREYAWELRWELSRGTVETFFAGARMIAKALSITGVVCGVRVEPVAIPPMQKIRYLDKLVRA